MLRFVVAMGSGWDRLHACCDVMRNNHSVAFSRDGACTNQAESCFDLALRGRALDPGSHARCPNRLTQNRAARS